MTDIFISYSHENEEWKDELKSHLSVLETHGDFSVWEDRQINPGDDWYPAIKQAIQSAKVAILLVSRDFLTSDFVKKEEIPELLQRRETDGLRVIPLIVKPCAWQAVPWLASLQGATKNNEPLAKFKPRSFEAESILSDFVNEVDRQLKETREQERLQRETEKRERLEAERKQHEVEETAKRAQQEIEESERRKAAEKLRQEQLKKEQAVAEEQRKEQQIKNQAEAKRRRQAEIERNKLREQQRQTAELEQQQRATAVKREKAEHREQNKQKLAGFAQNKIFLSILGLGVVASAAVMLNDGTTPQDKTFSFPIPEMVSIKAGTFDMGCVSGKGCEPDEKPVHPVEIAAFEIGKYEVTFEEWDACVADNVCYKPNDKWGRGKQPVIRVSWDDILVYIEWLNKKTGMKYRLPTESEWEYAARAETTTPFFTGDCINTDQANYNGDYSWDAGDCKKTDNYREKTLTVASFDANSFGLYNMHGNVWEWVQDCYHDSYTDAPKIGTAWEENCKKTDDGVSYRVLRGGSWYVKPVRLRSAFRYWSTPTKRFNSVGFRLARTP